MSGQPDLLAWMEQQREAALQTRYATLREQIRSGALREPSLMEGSKDWKKGLRKAIKAVRLPLAAALGADLAYYALYAACLEAFWRAHGLGFPALPPALVIAHMRLRGLSAEVKRLLAAVSEAGLECEGEEWLVWVHSAWITPEQEEINAFTHDGGKVDLKGMARDTQIFTDRYMVDWMVQNTLGPLWLCICERNGWTAEVVSSGAMLEMERRREVWREAREAGEIALHEHVDLGPHGDRWGFYVARPIPESLKGAVPLDLDLDPATRASAPASLDALKILEPAVGTGAFLLGALDHLLPLMEEEDRHRGRVRSKVERAAAAATTLTACDIDLKCINVCKAVLYAHLARYAGETVRVPLKVISTPVLQLDGVDERTQDDLATVLQEDRQTLPHIAGFGLLWRLERAISPRLWRERGGNGPGCEERTRAHYEAMGRLLEIPAVVEGADMGELVRRLAVQLGEGADDPEQEGWCLLLGQCIDRFSSPWHRFWLGGGVTGGLVKE